MDTVKSMLRGAVGGTPGADRTGGSGGSGGGSSGGGSGGLSPQPPLDDLERSLLLHELPPWCVDYGPANELLPRDDLCSHLLRPRIETFTFVHMCGSDHSLKRV